MLKVREKYGYDNNEDINAVFGDKIESKKTPSQVEPGAGALRT